MRINPIKNNNATSFKAVQENAARRYLMSKEFMQNYQTEKDRFEYFLEKQSHNRKYHVCWDDISEKYIIAELVTWVSRVVPGNSDTVDNKVFRRVNKEKDFRIEEYKGYYQMIEDAEERGFDYCFDDIYEAGDVCDQYEKTFREQSRVVKSVDTFDVGGEFRNKYLKYCI